MSVRMGLLALLADGPTHGYQLKASFEERTGGVWSVNVGQVYTTLDRLRVDGLAEPTEADDLLGDGRDRRPWRITSAGKEALDGWFDEPAVDEVPPREDLLVKVLLALGRSRSEALAVIDRQRAELYRLTQAARRHRRPPEPAEPSALVALSAELMADAVASRHEAALRWLDHCETLLTSRPVEPVPPASPMAAPPDPTASASPPARSTRTTRKARS